MDKPKNSKPLPLWSRALIAVVTLVILTSFTGVIGAAIVVKKQFEHAQEPASIANLARRIVLLPEPLPKGYTYVLGVDLWMFQIITIDFMKGKQQLVFFGCPTSETMDSREMLTQAYEQGVNTFEVQTKFSDVLSEGSWLIQGVQIPYRVGKLSGSDGTGLVACFVNQQRKKALLLYAVQPTGEQFDMKVCTNLIQDMQGF